MASIYVLGLSAFFHDSAACLLRDGHIVAAAQEERFTRKKFDSSFPVRAGQFCLQQAGITFDEVDYVGFYEKPLRKFERIIRVYAESFPKGMETFRKAIAEWAWRKLWTPGVIKSNLLALSPTDGQQMKWDGETAFSEHHVAHAASAYFPSPFSEAAILTLDGVGEWATTSLGTGKLDDRGVPRVTILQEIHYPDSLGLLYSAFTYLLGFKVNAGEYKLMGLAPYGSPRYVDLILKELIDVAEDGSYQLNLAYFSFPYAAVMINRGFCKLFNLPPRRPEAPFLQKHLDIAASIQVVTEMVVQRSASHLYRQTGMRRLCLAGGVALNCVSNGKLLRDSPFEDIWIQPAAGDAGGALGAALFVWHEVLGGRRPPPLGESQDLMQGSLLGPEYSSTEVEEALQRRGLPFRRVASDELSEVTGGMLVDGMVVGWFQGRMEYGPRALGARSILGDARSREMQRIMNVKIKYRESFRPFAPAVLREKVADWFELNGKNASLLGGPDEGYDSPYMLLVANVKADKCLETTADEQQAFGIDKLNFVRSKIPACTHVDYSARIQTVTQESNRLFYDLLRAFNEKTGVPLLVNTSFNIRGEPIVCTPDEAINCFLGTDMDALVLGTYVVIKSEMPQDVLVDYRSKFALD